MRWAWPPNVRKMENKQKNAEDKIYLPYNIVNPGPTPPKEFMVLITRNFKLT